MKRLPQLLALAAVLACSDAPFAPTVENMAGDYTAHVLLTSDNAGAVDWIARGATLTLGLGRDGTTSGHLFVPGGGDGGSDLDADMAGVWLLVGGKVSFGQTADHTFDDGTRVRVVLTK